MTTTTHGHETWLSVQDAAAMLGVSPATLRRWSAAGEVEAFTTPGGHRRFALTTLKSLLQQGTGDVARPSALGVSAERMTRVLRRHARAASGALPTLQVAGAVRSDLAALGCRLTAALLAQLDAETPEQATRASREADSAAGEHAVVCARAGVQLTDVVAVFVRFRGLFVGELADAAIRHGLGSAEATSLVTRGGGAVDQALGALVSAWQDAAG